MGHIQGIATAVSTDRYIGSVLKYTHERLAKAFDEQMDVIALGNPSAYNHVYEWRMLGLPQGRLWKHKATGTGSMSGVAGKVREGTFQFKASTRPILTPEERHKDSNDPMSAVPLDIIAMLKPRKYFFYNKASMMEYGLAATVRPKYGKFLFVPTRNSALSGSKWRDSPSSMSGNGFYLAKSTQQNFQYRNPQDSSGGSGTVGRFTSTWVEWWANEALCCGIKKLRVQ